MRPMTLPEKILYHQSEGIDTAGVSPGQIIVVKVARTLASELTWVGMNQCMKSIGDPQIWRKDRFFLAVDHSVDPRNYNDPVIQGRISACKEFADKVSLDDYWGPNESILHTEFYKQRAEPGTVIFGADSHSCAHGCVGAFAAGAGAADVVTPLVTGRNWLSVPQTVLIEFTGNLRRGLVGKDVILWVLKNFGRNTVALDRVIEFAGNLKDMSIDSRFAISNMSTEFGAIAGVFQADEITHAFVLNRQARPGKDEQPHYFRADKNAEYVKRLVLNLNEVRPSVAMWPEPDRVFTLDDPKLYEPLIDPVSGETVKDTIKNLDGVFIGACTTTESEIALAGLVLEIAMDKFGMKPVDRQLEGVKKPYKRRMTPGSALMTASLEKNGICDIYRRAGFQIGAPGCSYCLGVAVDKAEEGEVWLSSQNRNFRNRMGRGAIGSISSAAVVAASSFCMSITDPTNLLDAIAETRFKQFMGFSSISEGFAITEPEPQKASGDAVSALSSGSSAATVLKELGVIRGKAQIFGDSIDTDAIIPAQYIPLRDAELGEKSFCIYRPEFVQRVKQGCTIVVAGMGFGCGSSREEAVSCLKWAGIQGVIAKSFSFIFGRNLLALDLFGVTIQDDDFYKLVSEGADVEIDVPKRSVLIRGKSFPFQMSEIQEEIYRQGGVVSMYREHGNELFKELTKTSVQSCQSGKGCGNEKW